MGVALALQLNLLGRFEVLRDGAPIDAWPRPGAKRLLKMLAVEPRHAMSAERIAATLWPDDSGSRPLQRLHNLVYLLRSTLETPALRGGGKSTCIQVKDHSISLISGNEIWIDVDEFEQRLDTALPDPTDTLRLERALELYHGPLLPDDPAEDWLTHPRNHLEQRYLNATHVLADRYKACGNHEGAIVVLQRLLKTAPADERAHRELIGLFGRVGRLFEAERQFAACKSALARELGVAPGDETRAVYRGAITQITTVVGTAAEAIPSVRFTPPAPLVHLIGRETFVRDVCGLLQGSSGRLFTLTGVGGIGKTQVALRLANELCSSYRHGVCFVSLAEVSENGVVDRIRQALGLTENPNEPPGTVTSEFLRDKHLLLVLDNFEHVLNSAALLPQLLSGSSRLTVLTTSRRRLNLAAEHVVPVPTLDVGDANATTTSPTKEPQRVPLNTQVAAVQLFAERALAVMPSFQLTTENVADVQVITRQLDGLPLAIELTAARSVLFDPCTLRQALQGGVGLVAGGGPDRPMRHRSLEDSLVWSYGLLSSVEQQVLQRLSLFAAPFELQAAMAICCELNADISLALQGLIDAGFVAKAPEAASATRQDPRFRLLQTTRAFARKRFHESGPIKCVSMYFANHFADLAAALNAILYTKTADAVDRFKSNVENFYAALDVAGTMCDDKLVCRLVQGLARFWGQYGAGHRASEWVQRALSTSNSLSSADNGWLQYAAGVYWGNYADYPKAVVCATTAIVCAQDAADSELYARASVMFAVAAGCSGDYTAARDALENSRSSVESLGDPGLLVSSRDMSAECYFHLGDLQCAQKIWLSCIEPGVEAPDRDSAPILDRLSVVALFQGNIDDAIHLSNRALLIERSSVPRQSVELQLLHTRFCLFCHIGDVARATEVRDEALLIASLKGSNWKKGIEQYEGVMALIRGDTVRAAEVLKRSADSESKIEGLLAFQLQAFLVWALSAQTKPDVPSISRAIAQLSSTGRTRPYMHPQVLEVAAAAFADVGEHLAAGRAWVQAESLRVQGGSKRFPVQQPYAEKTLETLETALGSDWRDRLRNTIPPISLDDPLGWLAEELSVRPHSILDPA